MSVSRVEAAAVSASLPAGTDLKNAVAVEFSINSGAQSITSFGGKALEVSVPVEAKKFENGKAYTAFVISADGAVENTTAKIVNGSAVLTMRHFSTVVVTDKAAVTFADVAAGAYYYDAVQWAVANKITAGTDNTHFSPNAPCDRGQTVTFLWRAAGSPAPKGTANPFTDVDESAYYYKAVLWAVENGITKGTSSTTFSPTDTVTRAQVVTFLCRLAKGSGNGENPFTDVADGAYYTEAVNWAAANEITKGTSTTTFSPDADCVRAQIVIFLYRYFA